MANCQITSISDKCGPSRTNEEIAAIPEGRVGQVCKEWLIREDGSLAYRLQNEEISHHYEENRSKNRIVRQDLPIAKHLQENELIEARNIRFQYNRYLDEQIQNDESIARQIEQNLLIEEQKSKRATEEADEKLAKKLIEKEKARQLRKRLEKEKQQVKRLSAQIGADYCFSSIETTSSPELLPKFSKPTYQRILTEDEQELDLSEFCMPPPPGLTPEELKFFLEEQDAEIARLLQQQELKRNKNPEKEKLAVIEAQDFEIAKMLQKQEKERVRRIKEKLRARQQRQQQDMAHSSQNFSFFNNKEVSINYQRSSTPISPQTSFEESQLNPPIDEHEYDIPENCISKNNNDFDNDSLTYEEPYQVLTQQNDNRIKQNFHNIAIDLDPTYQRRVQSRQSQSNLIESCVDDEDNQSANHSQISSPTESRLSIVARSHDSLEKLHRGHRFRDSQPSPFSAQLCQVTSTTSSRSSYTSSSSHHSIGNRSNKSLNEMKRCTSTVDNNDEDYAPPLPPRDGSLLTRNRIESIVEPNIELHSETYLPPHHPKHPNRRNDHSHGSLSPNRSSIYVPPSLQGQRRVLSMEKQKKDKHKGQDGCKTQ